MEKNPLERPLDIENVPKLIIDAFSNNQIDRDESRYSQMGLYPDDDLKYVRTFQIEGKFSDNGRNNTGGLDFRKEVNKWVLGSEAYSQTPDHPVS